MRASKITLGDLNKTYCCICETPLGAKWAKSLPESRKWLANNLGKHVEGYHLVDDGRVVGHIYYAMSDEALVPYEVEPRVAIVYCTEMLHDYMHKGYGKLMFDYMKEDLKKQGVKGIVVPSTTFKEFMHYEFFLKQGLKVIMEHAPFKVMYYPLNKQNISIKRIDLNYKPSKEKVEVTLFNNLFCPVGAYMHSLVKRVAKTFGDKVKIVEIEATLETIRKYGTSDPLINGKIKMWGPTSEAEVGKAIQEEVDSFKR
ncbi:GNAT family N-acetyltransferase [Candidatus Bathyarchaeota archaeon]|nr:GNAT family N-acetyltransferase [Candidatus Bathyarchaeota archaeon]